jgi:hypothetical protein
MAKTRAQQVQSVTGTDLIVLGRAAARSAVKERYGELIWVDRDDTERRQRRAEEEAAQSARKSDRICRLTTMIGFGVIACIIAISGGWLWH